MTNPFTLFDIPLILVLLWAIVFPGRISLSKLSPEVAGKWRPRIRPVAIGLLALFVASCYAFHYFLPRLPEPPAAPVPDAPASPAVPTQAP